MMLGAGTPLAGPSGDSSIAAGIFPDCTCFVDKTHVCMYLGFKREGLATLEPTSPDTMIGNATTPQKATNAYNITPAF